jgi:hypothetical protein
MPTSSYDALTMDTNVVGPFEQGDIAIVIKPDGTVKAMNFGNDAQRLRHLEPEDFTPADKIAYEQGRRLLALSMAASNPQMMEVMMAMLDDPVVSEELAKLARRH